VFRARQPVGGALDPGQSVDRSHAAIPHGDQLWFSLFHEIGHLLEGGRRPEVVEEIADEELTRPDEQAANAFAREALLPQDQLDRWLAEDVINRASISKFAANQGIALGMVVGRLQRDRRLKPSELNRLKRHFEAPPAVEISALIALAARESRPRVSPGLRREKRA
jgi:HTH-type transcriptional regulator/antitoxin HigA